MRNSARKCGRPGTRYRLGACLPTAVWGLMVFLAVFLASSVPANAQPPSALADPEGLWAQATLYRDEWGVPHVYAQNPRALSYAFGYAQAEDHIEGMLMAYRYANGRAAEVRGEIMADSDVFALRMANAALANAAMPQADTLTRDLCEGFALGVNAWLLDHPGAAPVWAEPVQAADILALWHAYILSFAPFDLPGAYRQPPAAFSGNAWALAPGRTSEHQTLLVVNPHQYFDGPFRWYEAHLSAGDYDVNGATLFGLPVLLLGHNPVLGWGLTPNAPDTADMFEERITGQGDSDAPAIVRFLQRAEPMFRYLSKAQPYRVRTAAGFDERSVPVFVGPRGPIFEASGGFTPAQTQEARPEGRRPAAVTSNYQTPGAGSTALFTYVAGGYNTFGGLRQLFEMGRSRTMAAFQGVLSAQQLPCFHLVYADKAGNLFYAYLARTWTKTQPPNAPLQDWKSPIPTEFQRYASGAAVPPANLPSITKPAWGYVQACGNPPWGATEDSGLHPGAWPDWFIGDNDSYRAQRVRRLLHAGKLSFKDMESMLYDTYAPAASDLTPGLIAAAGSGGAPSPALASWMDVLRGWNYDADVDTPAMTFYDAWWSMLKQRLGPEHSSDAAVYQALAAGASGSNLAREAAAAAAERLGAGASLSWGAAHRVQRGKRNEAIPGTGPGQSIFTASREALELADGGVHYGFGYALAVQFGDTPKAVSVVPFGASEDPASPHFDDQLDLLLAKRFKSSLFADEDVLRQSVSAFGRRVTLAPPGIEGMLAVNAAQPVSASIKILDTSPAPLPPGLAPYTLLAGIEVVPEAAPVSVDAALRVPKVLCLPSNLPQLSLYAFTPSGGWQRVAGQRFEPRLQEWRGSFPGTGAFAVLGPAELRLEGVESEPADPEPAATEPADAAPPQP